MSNLNRVYLADCIVKDAEMRYTGSGKSILGVA